MNESEVLKKVLKVFLARGKCTGVENKLIFFSLEQKKLRFQFLVMILEAVKNLRINVRFRKVKKGKFTEKSPAYLMKKQRYSHTYRFFKRNIAFSAKEISAWVLNNSRVRRLRENYYNALYDARLNIYKKIGLN